MSETNAAKKEPGQVAHAAMQAHFEPHGYKWAELRPASQAEWADVERAVLDAYAPRLATLEVVVSDLHRQLSEARVEVQAHRKGRVEAEHQRDVLVGKVGRDVLAALVAAVPARVADVLTGARHIDEAMQKALDDAVTRAERAEAEIARLSALLTPRPDAGLAGMAAREAVTVERKPPFKWNDEAWFRLVPGASVMWHDGGFMPPRRIVVRAIEMCREWLVNPNDECAKLSNCDPATIEPPATKAAPVERPAAHLPVSCAKCGHDDVTVGIIGGVFCCSGCVERPPAPDLRKGDRVRTLATYGAKEWQVTGDPVWRAWSETWAIPVEGEADVPTHLAGDAPDRTTRVRTWQPGEVVPWAPVQVKRQRTLDAQGFEEPWSPHHRLAEPWTQTGL